jgi:hypothetical protein
MMMVTLSLMRFSIPLICLENMISRIKYKYSLNYVMRMMMGISMRKILKSFFAKILLIKRKFDK